ncbi:DUF3168 domain-containing protein [Paracoccus sp. Z330]|uniref:DUF3168 domain-containing protein n=1 Tax=Paracoccus onchidii TaxID=3017813 RepID=A0ABT4ZJR8_9RHOB|nr:DUF3168 domain-containing protein [Paracoccus onchidii]MDB6179553.1 DUF3168 domain-containing protein [Paracoccus onchidii]
MSVDLESQKALRARFTTTAAITSLVPASSILDTNQRPAPVPSIIMGESQVVDEGTSLKRQHSRVYHTLHVWTREASLEGVKAICSEIRRAVQFGPRLVMADPYHCADLRVSQVRTLRDPDGEHSHGIVTVEALISEALT